MSLSLDQPIIITQNAGFFSCCTNRLLKIIQYLNEHQQLPHKVQSHSSFRIYKPICRSKDDIFYDFFRPIEPLLLTIDLLINFHLPIKFCADKAHRPYRNNDYVALQPLIKIYFQPSDKISQLVDQLEKKYQIDYDNLCAIYYRGTDKKKEVPLPNYSEIIGQVQKLYPSVTSCLLQSDESSFISYGQQQLIQNGFSAWTFSENQYCQPTRQNIHYCQSTDQNYQHMLIFLPIIIILSKCKYIVCNSSNVSFWIILFRGNTKNIIQYRRGEFLQSS